MPLNCLQIIQTVCARVGVLQPNAVVTSQDSQIAQLLALSNQEGMALVKRHNWQVLQTEATFTTVGAQLQGTLSTIAPGCKYIANDTIWDRTRRMPVIGSKSAQEWQEMLAMNLTSPFPRYRVKGDSLFFYPIPAVGHTCSFEYVSKNWVSTNAGGTAYLWSSDLDTPLLDEDLIIAGIVWRWKAAKGLNYAEDFAVYERDLADAMARDSSAEVLNLRGTSGASMDPIVIIPSGSWGS
jgi:hypothetical protein